MIEKFLQTYIKERLYRSDHNLFKNCCDFFLNYMKFMNYYLKTNVVIVTITVIMSFVFINHNDQIMIVYYIISLFIIFIYCSCFVYMGKSYLGNVMVFNNVSYNMIVINDSISSIFGNELNDDKRQMTVDILAKSIENKKNDRYIFNVSELVKLILPCLLSPITDYIINKYSLLSGGLLSLSTLSLSLIYTFFSNYISSYVLHICKEFDFTSFLSRSDYNNIINDLNVYKIIGNEYIRCGFNNVSKEDENCFRNINVDYLMKHK